MIKHLQFTELSNNSKWGCLGIPQKGLNMKTATNEITIGNFTFKGKSYNKNEIVRYDSLQHADIIDSIIYDWIEFIEVEREDPEVFDQWGRITLLFCLTYASNAIRYL